ncbi:hypothetical protein [Ancylobacter pratisalsi]|uniref:Uncharacterized protein n=1 Tax=Ancylobacter pratisalsi TaxID=1745854 RepID=A0A6P1YST1_9HYPH|nr:hypothetical protein [Ancylobacter pratisalsi]QIB34734.1 hypothetical protein G3A50_14240 [Ancylobacter pratisalsi]
MRVSDTAGAARIGVLDDTGVMIYPDSYAVTAVTRDPAYNLLTTTISDGSTTWVQTITRDAAGNFATVSRWVRQ